jgi:hypothetical protein
MNYFQISVVTIVVTCVFVFSSTTQCHGIATHRRAYTLNREHPAAAGPSLSGGAGAVNPPTAPKTLTQSAAGSTHPTSTHPVATSPPPSLATNVAAATPGSVSAGGAGAAPGPAPRPGPGPAATKKWGSNKFSGGNTIANEKDMWYIPDQFKLDPRIAKVPVPTESPPAGSEAANKAEFGVAKKQVQLLRGEALVGATLAASKATGGEHWWSRVSQYVAQYQKTSGQAHVDGKLGSVTAQTIDYSQLDAADEEHMKHVAEYAQDTAIPKRVRIVQLALSQVGYVHSSDRGDGKKYGGKRIIEFYKKSYEAPGSGYQDWWTDGLMSAANGNTNGYISRGGKRAGPWSWCGIFATWAIRSVTGRGHWGLGKAGGGYLGIGSTVWGKINEAKPGDLMYLKSKLSHQCVMLHNDMEKKEVTCVDGNGFYQGISVTVRPYSQYVGYLSASDEAAPSLEQINTPSDSESDSGSSHSTESHSQSAMASMPPPNMSSATEHVGTIASSVSASAPPPAPAHTVSSVPSPVVHKPQHTGIRRTRSPISVSHHRPGIVD